MTSILKILKENDRWWIWLQNVLSLGVFLLAPLRRASGSQIQIVLGAALFLLGAVIGVQAVRDLSRNRSPHPEPLTGSILVRSGIYSVIRHPIYASLLLVLFGWSIGWNSLPASIIASALAILLDRKARLEERYLCERFQEYGAYAATVKRFVPGLY